jgi:hypothetical protein
MSKIIFYHAYLVGDYKLLIQEQIANMFNSGLYKASEKIFMGIAGGDSDAQYWVLNLIKDYKKIQPYIHPTNNEEKDTLKLILKNIKENDYICYFHTKSVTKPHYNNILWRRLVEYHTINQWKNCIDILDKGYDCVGSLYREDTFLGFHPHFSGGYWWTTYNHIVSLDHSYLDSNHSLGRFGAEFWIGSKHGSKNYCTFDFEEGTEPYNEEYLISNYIKE